MRRAVLLLVLNAACDRGASAPPRQRAPADAAPAIVVPRPPPPVPGVHQRALTVAELALLRPIYRDSVDYASVRVIDDHFTPFQPDTVYMTPEGSIYAPGDLWRDDFAAASVDPYTQAVFVHELAHVWQFQNGMDMIAEGMVALARGRGDYEKAYAYTLTPGADLLDFGMEQQASILEDRFLIAVYALAPTRMDNAAAADRDALYAAVLARFDVDATYARGVSAEEQMQRHIAAAKGEPPGAPGCGLPVDAQKAPHLCNWRFDDR
jgi:hypothetical protein